ncbi:hypothetical protein ABK040_015602 [Willaertia magna]
MINNQPQQSNSSNNPSTGLPNVETMVFHASQALDRATKLQAFIADFKSQILEYEKSLQYVQKSVGEINSKVSGIDVRDHRELQTFVLLMHNALRQSNDQNVILQERLDRIYANDLDSFEKSWKLIKNFINNYVKSSKKNLKKKTNSKSEQIKEIRENKGLRKKIYEGMEDLRIIFEEYVHSQLFYHSKCLETWGKVWEQAAENRKEEVKRRKEEEEKEEELLNKLLQDTSSILITPPNNSNPNPNQ